MVQARGTDSAKVIQVIETTALIGGGTASDPCRLVTQYWDLEGKLLCDNDYLIMEAHNKKGQAYAEHHRN